MCIHLIYFILGYNKNILLRVRKNVNPCIACKIRKISFKIPTFLVFTNGNFNDDIPKLK